jgi:hypothetical protein
MRRLVALICPVAGGNDLCIGDEVGTVASDQVGLEEQEHDAECNAVERVVPQGCRRVASFPVLPRIMHNLHAAEAPSQELTGAHGMQVRE